ncbi:DcaP family trimeric outer membrane transporter [Emcibacter sp.]|uniref:DcaP family trimeric outer membrane transporter n=1 Tax=Emcibacter sp. TaxID=1979954 RepID=UPI003A8CB11D
MTGINKFTRVLLLSGTMLVTVPALSANAQTVEDRLNKLESALDKILQKLDNQGSKLTEQETEIVNQAKRITKQEKMVSSAPAAAGGKQADGFMVGSTNIKIGGYVKLDTMVSHYSDGAPASGNLGRDFYIPSLTTVSPTGDGQTVTDFNPRETRLKISTSTPAGDSTVSTVLEMDFQVTSGGDERTTNGYSPRLRQALITYDNWTFGQGWSTFQDVSALAENLDFIGPAEGTVFVRQSMVRYKNGPLEIAIEQPETTVTSSAGARVLPGTDTIPDVIARYTMKSDWGHVALAGMLRSLSIDQGTLGVPDDDSALGYGVSLSGKLKVADKDDFRFMVTAGEGLGRYIGVNLVNGAAVNATGELETIGTISGFASYRHFWGEKSRSNITFSYFKADNPVAFTGTGVTDTSMSIHANYIYSPVPKLDVGIEYMYAERELENGLSGNMSRVQFSTKYAF